MSEEDVTKIEEILNPEEFERAQTLELASTCLPSPVDDNNN